MSILDLLDGLKNVGGRVAKGLMIEAYIAYNEDELLSSFKEILDNANIRPDDIPDFVYKHMALPIPQDAFTNMKGFEDYLETIDEKRIFEWITKARPDLGLALAACGDEGAEYVARLKWFFVDSIKAAPEKEKQAPTEPTEDAPVPEEPAPDFVGDETSVTQSEEPTEQKPEAVKRYLVTCNECGSRFNLTQEQIDALKECPACGKAADLNC